MATLLYLTQNYRLFSNFPAQRLKYTRPENIYNNQSLGGGLNDRNAYYLLFLRMGNLLYALSSCHF